MSEMHIFPATNVRLSLHVWPAYIPRNKCDSISTCRKRKYSPKHMWAYLYMCLKCIHTPKHMWSYLYLLEMHVYPDTPCEPISTCLTCIYSPKQMWAYLYMPEMHIFPATNVSLSLHVWHACIPRNKCEPISIIHVCNAYIPRNTCEPSSTCLKCVYIPRSKSEPVSTYIPRSKFKCEPVPNGHKRIYSRKKMWA